MILLLYEYIFKKTTHENDIMIKCYEGIYTLFPRQLVTFTEERQHSLSLRFIPRIYVYMCLISFLEEIIVFYEKILYLMIL